MSFKQVNKIFFYTISAIFVLVLVSPASAEEYGPPEGMQYGPPAGIPSMPANLPTGVNMPSVNMGPPANMGPSEEQIQAMQKKGEEQQLKGMKQGAVGMEKAYKQMQNSYANLEKKGLEISQTTKDKLDSIKKDIETIKSAQSVDELQSVDQEALQQKISDLGDGIGKYQQMQGLKKMLSSMERGVASFESRLGTLEKQGLTIPTSVKDNLGKLKDGLTAIKNAKSPEELDAVNPDDLGDLMDKVNESRPQLEMLAKWPRILKQADQQLKRFNTELAKTKTLVDRLAAKQIDLSTDYNAFKDDVAKLQSVRDAADALVKEGNSEEAFTKMEEEFFNQLDNVGEHQRVIQMMSNLSRFTAQFKSGMADAQKAVKRLTAKKVDVTELRAIYDQALAKGNSIVSLINTKPIDEDAILSVMDEMENLKQQFQDKADELAGGQVMPWETKTPAQFKDLTLPKDFDKYIPKPTATNP